MELYLLRYFMAVVETGSFTRAARNENVTQPTLSAGIRKLEEGVGRPLFERSNKRVFLTDAGTRFLNHAKAILHEVNLAKDNMRISGRQQVLRIGTLITLSEWRISGLLSQFTSKYPDFEIEVIDGTERELSNRLEDRSLDYALTIIRSDSPQAIPLYSEGYRFAQKKGVVSLDGQESIHPSQLLDRNMVVRTRCEMLSETSRYFTAENIRPRLAYRSRNDSRALAMVAAGVGGGLFPESVLADSPYKDQVNIFTLQGFDQQRQIGLIRSATHSDSERDLALSVFAEESCSYFRDVE